MNASDGQGARGGRSFTVGSKWSGKAPVSAADRHTRIVRGQGATAANPAGTIVSMKKMGGLKGNDSGTRQV